MTVNDLIQRLHCSKSEKYTGQILADGVSVNLSGFYTQLIKDAARCNSYSSDIVYSINEINEKLKEYPKTRTFESVWIGFRKHGVDHGSFVLSHVEDDPYKVYSEYFALYSVEVEPDGYGFVQVVIKEYWC